MIIANWLNRGATFVVFSALLLASSAEIAPAKQKAATKSGQSDEGVAAEYVSHAITLAQEHYWAETGFKISPNGVFNKFAGLGEDVRQDARMRELYSENPTLWKEVAPALSQKYAELQKAINHSKFSATERYRSDISRTLTQLVEARGGGSASALLHALIPAETEWVLKQMAVQQTQPTSDQDFELALARSIIYWDEPSGAGAAAIKKAVAELRRAEQSMEASQVASERQEILKFFQE